VLVEDDFGHARQDPLREIGAVDLGHDQVVVTPHAGGTEISDRCVVGEPGAAEARLLVEHRGGDAVLGEDIDVAVQPADAAGRLIVIRTEDEYLWHDRGSWSSLPAHALDSSASALGTKVL